MEPKPTMTRQEYWRAQIRRIAFLMAIWAVVGFGMSIFFAEPLNAFSLGGVPFGFWMAQQGSIYVFIVLVLAYAILSDRADRAAGLHETEGTTSGASDAH